MLNVENVSYGFIGKEVLEEITFSLQKDQHAALIGSSGSGKSTLVDLIRDTNNFGYHGTIQVKEHARIGYVSQFYLMEEEETRSVVEYISEEFVRLQKRMEELGNEMAIAEDVEPLMEEFQQVFDLFTAMGGDDYESQITKQLYLANLTRHEQLPVNKLSGGEFKLIQVIKVMLTTPNLLIMDEPDVFLDFENLNALKNLINSHKGTMLIVTHNRYLLNHCFNKILHLENKQIQEFEGTYIDYRLELLIKKIEQMEQSVADDLEIERNKKIVDHLRNQATFHAEAARGKALKARVKIAQRLEERRIKAPFIALKEPSILLTMKNEKTAEQINEETLAIQVKEYGVEFEDVILEKVNFEIKANEKVALVGGNGTGKTTLLRDVYKNQKESIQRNEELAFGFLSQFQGEMLTETNTLYEEFFELGFETKAEIALFLEGVGLKEETLKQTIATLSGGEKNLLQLAKISREKADFLLLDEPFSHLDTYSQVALEKALSNYKGGILMVSHDFYSIVNTMDYVLFVGEKTVRKMSIRKFRKIMYGANFDQQYLELEEKKTILENRIEQFLIGKDFLSAGKLSIELEQIVLKMNK